MKAFLHLMILFSLAPALARADVTFDVIATYTFSGFTETYATKVDEAGDVAGTARDGAGHSYGYIRGSDGHFSHFVSFPGSSFTEVLGINNHRQICGDYDGPPKPGNGFRAVNRRFVTSNFPRAQYTAVFDLNDEGNYCGWESDGGTYFAFINIDKAYTSFSVAGAATTAASDINSLNQCVGFYDAGSFFRDADGTLTYPITVPGFDFTELRGLDDTGRMVGWGSMAGTFYAVLFLTPTDVALYQYPGAVSTTFLGINSSGVISGYWDDGEQVHALIVQANITQ